MDSSVGKSRAVMLLTQILGAIVIAATAVGFTISFAAIVFSGPMAPALQSGIAHTLLGVAAMTLIGAFTYGYRGTIAQPQDVTSLLLAGAVAGFASSNIEDPTATSLALIVLASALSGLLLIITGWLNAGFLVRFIPYPVIGGFLAATGYLLLAGGLGLVTEGMTMALAFSLSGLAHWGPWLVAGLVLLVISINATFDLALPVGLLAVLALFYPVIAVLGISLEDASKEGFLLGPFEGGSLIDALRFDALAAADWGTLMTQGPTLLAVMLLTVIGALLNAAGLEVALDIDGTPRKDLRATAFANLGAAVTGCLPGYQLIGETVLATRIGLRSALAGLSACGGALATLWFGTAFLGYLPLGFFATLLIFLGLDLLYSWLWLQRKRLSRNDMAIILIIVLVAALVGFLEALLVGLIVAALLFLLAYAQLDMVRVRATAAQRRSRIERPASQLEILSEHGAETVILELQGFLFFGTAQALADKVRQELAATPAPLRILLDFARVSGLDASAAQALVQTAKAADKTGAQLILTGLAQPDAEKIMAVQATPNQLATYPSLDAALEAIETDLLKDTEAFSNSALLEALLPLVDTGKSVLRRRVNADQILLDQGASGGHVYLLVSGAVQAEVTGPDGNPLRVAGFLAGALMGEMAHYTQQVRSASLRAQTDVDVLSIDPHALAIEAPDTARLFHQQCAEILARRVARSTALLQQAGLT